MIARHMRTTRSDAARVLVGIAALLLAVSAARAEGQATPTVPPETLFVYGPGGPLPAMKDAAAAFERKTGAHIVLTGGPTGAWLAKARGDADVIFSGAENMMTDYVRQLGDTAGGAGPRAGRIDESTIVPLYLRPAAILVRKGNPKRITRFEDLLRPGMKVLVVQGAGGEGKTTFAAELVRWLVATRRFTRAAFTSVEQVTEARQVLFSIGAQLVPN